MPHLRIVEFSSSSYHHQSSVTGIDSGLTADLRLVPWVSAYSLLERDIFTLSRSLPPVRCRNLHSSEDFAFLSHRCSKLRSFCSPSTTKSKIGHFFQNQLLVRSWSVSFAVMGSEVHAGAVLPALKVYVEEAFCAVRDARVIAVPTDTLYGFACEACCKEAINNIYEIKGRKYTSPLAICVGDVTDISRFAVADHLPDGLLYSLLPGPVTVVLRRGDSSILEKSLNPVLDTIGIRVPDSEFIRSVARDCGSALALTSANLSGQPSSVSFQDFENLWQHCAFVFDNGLLPSGSAGSTVVDLTMPKIYKILRPGSAEKETVSTLKRFGLEEAR